MVCDAGPLFPQQLGRLSLTTPDSISYGIAGFVPNLSNAGSSDDLHRAAVCY
jgi:hypothetical protein